MPAKYFFTHEFEKITFLDSLKIEIDIYSLKKNDKRKIRRERRNFLRAETILRLNKDKRRELTWNCV